MIPEKARNREHFDQMFAEVCCQDANAIHTCWAVFQFLHVVDDLFDRDVDQTADTVALALLVFLEAVAANPFFQANRDVLITALRTGVFEWADSERWRHSEDPAQKAAVRVLKSQYQNFFYVVAGLCGGLPHMQNMSLKYREYQPE